MAEVDTEKENGRVLMRNRVRTRNCNRAHGFWILDLPFTPEFFSEQQQLFPIYALVSAIIVDYFSTMTVGVPRPGAERRKPTHRT